MTMLIKVKVFPESKESEISRKSPNSFVVRLKSEPKKGAANAELKNVLASYFHISPAMIRIVKGGRSFRKIIEIRE